jgi:hypothetical protein
LNDLIQDSQIKTHAIVPDMQGHRVGRVQVQFHPDHLSLGVLANVV